MALKTVGSLATTTLHGLQYSPDALAMANADLASIVESIYYDQGGPAAKQGSKYPPVVDRGGLLTIPDRGTLKLYPGDWVVYDPSGFPFLIPARSLPKTLTLTGNTHTSTLVDSLSGSALTAGWRVGASISESNGDLPAGCKIASIAANGLSITLTAAATGTHTGGTLTVGDWTHS